VQGRGAHASRISLTPVRSPPVNPSAPPNFETVTPEALEMASLVMIEDLAEQTARKAGITA